MGKVKEALWVCDVCGKDIESIDDLGYDGPTDPMDEVSEESSPFVAWVTVCATCHGGPGHG